MSTTSLSRFEVQAEIDGVEVRTGYSFRTAHRAQTWARDNATGRWRIIDVGRGPEPVHGDWHDVRDDT